MYILYHIEDNFCRRLRQPTTAKMMIWICHCRKNFIKVDIDNRRYQKNWSALWHNIPFYHLTSGATRLLDQCSKCGLTWWIVYDDPIKEDQSPERDFLSDLIVFEKDGLWQIATQDRCPFCDNLIDRYQISDVLICHSCKATSLSKEELEIHFVLAQNQSRF